MKRGWGPKSTFGIAEEVVKDDEHFSDADDEWHHRRGSQCRPGHLVPKEDHPDITLPTFE
jgi:hypothetical protein